MLRIVAALALLAGCPPVQVQSGPVGAPGPGPSRGPRLSERCGPAETCGEGDCLTYYGIAGPNGPRFQTCELRCGPGAGRCPGGTACVRIADGPGNVCRPGHGPPPPSWPRISEVCGAGDRCGEGACVTYYGFAGPSGPQFKTCEIPCGPGAGACPKGTGCVNIADGPGNVCRPGEGPPPPPPSWPKISETCGAGDRCGEGSCVTYYGIAGPRGPQIKTCEIKCSGKGRCPPGMSCTTIADGPGSVCRPGGGPPQCGPTPPTSSPPPGALKPETIRTPPGTFEIKGHWAWESCRYVWVPGRAEPVRPGFTYKPGNWNQVSGGWAWVEGQWIASCTENPPLNNPPPGAPKPETIRTPPGTFEVKGHWAWQSCQYVWVPGYAERDRPGFYWKPGDWNQRSGHWYWTDGRWIDRGGGSPPAGPKVSEACGAGDRCGEGSCVTYYGIAGPRGPQFKTCEIKCAGKGGCPAGMSCTTIADGPGTVCRPGAPPPPPPAGPKISESCGPNDRCGEGTCVTYYGIAGPRGPQFKTCEIKCGKGAAACPAGRTCATIADGPGQVCR